MNAINYVDGAANRIVETGAAWVSAANKHVLAEKLGLSIVERLQAALDSDKHASLVVSGGSTPAPVFSYLSNIDIDWSKVTVTLADERWVAPGHADSNETLVRDTLMVNHAASAKFVSLYRGPAESAPALAEATAELDLMAKPFTVVILGMGNDGHTASLFPDAPASELASAMALDNTELVSFMHPPSVAQTRITLNRAALLNSMHRYLHMTGEQKCEVLYEALGAGPERSYVVGMAPVTSLLLEEPESVSVYWSP